MDKVDFTTTGATHGHQTTKTHARIHHLGLDQRDALVIESLFRQAPHLAEHYVYGPSQQGDPVDLVFVNADNPVAMVDLVQLQQQRPTVAAVMVSEREQAGRGPCLRRPLNFRDSLAILDAITSTDSTHSQRIPSSRAPNELRVLVVDDSFPARQFIKFKLEELAGSTLSVLVDFADSGEKAMQCVRDTAYDLVFLDVVMPGIDGYETCARIKQIRPVRVAMLTGQASPVDFTRGRSAGCDNYLPKPPNDIDLRSVLRLTSLKKASAH